ncbi:MAG: HD domain-containing protein [Lachnospiraceae bacterium]|nr:HD domain-containing protein [Lachnospiraceae bacterium]
MLFKKTDELKVGMRLARPIYNKSGVLLYDRNSLLSPQGIESIRNFGLIGIYILEPAEPVPPMTQADIEFERFQTMCVFAIADELNRILSTKKQQRTHFIVADIIKNYGYLTSKINFVQNLRSNEDYIFKHSMNVAIMAALLSKGMNLSLPERNDVVIAALLHDIGKLSLPIEVVFQEEENHAGKQKVKSAVVSGFSIIDEAFPSNPAVKRMCTQYLRMKEAAEKGETYRGEDKILPGAFILHIADTFDAMTAMRLEKHPASEVTVLKYLLERQEIYRKPVIDTLTSCINILNQGVSVELNNGDKALVLAENSYDILRPMLLNFRNNTIMDLSDKSAYGNIEIVDIMRTMDNRHVIDLDALKNQGISVDESEFVTPRG